MLATNYFAVARPSLSNYLAMTSGSTWGITDNGYHELPSAVDLGAQLTRAGISWRAYNEGLTDTGCLRSPYPYALKHNPFAYYGGKCPPNVVPLTALAADLAGDTPRFSWIKPGLCNDGHDCALDVAGAWLEATVSQLLASPAWRPNSLIFIVWEEGNGGDCNLVPLIVVRHDRAAGRTVTHHDRPVSRIRRSRTRGPGDRHFLGGLCVIILIPDVMGGCRWRSGRCSLPVGTVSWSRSARAEWDGSGCLATRCWTVTSQSRRSCRRAG